jgi:hypothetical protein
LLDSAVAGGRVGLPHDLQGGVEGLPDLLAPRDSGVEELCAFACEGCRCPYTAATYPLVSPQGFVDVLVERLVAVVSVAARLAGCGRWERVIGAVLQG